MILPPISEKAFLAQVIQLARLRGFETYHTHRSTHSAAGFPDLVMGRARDHRLIFAELKSERGRTTREQERWLSLLRGIAQVVPIEVYLWRPSDWQAIEMAME